MNLFRLKSGTFAGTAISVIIGAVIAAPICVSAVSKWQRASGNAPPASNAAAETSPYVETETQIEGVRIYKPYEDAYTEQGAYYSFIPLTPDQQHTIYSLCQQYEIAYDLMLAIARTESGFDMEAVGVGGDKGMFQINEFWSDKELSWDLPEWRTSLADNTELALRIMAECLEYADGNLNIALNYYNSGYPEEVYYEDGTSYCERVFANYQSITEQEENYGERKN